MTQKKGKGKVKDGNAPAPEEGASPSPSSQGQEEINVVQLISEVSQLRAIVAQLKDENRWLRNVVQAQIEDSRLKNRK